jgi:hypothetical protein
MKILFLFALVVLVSVIFINDAFAQYMGNVGSKGETEQYPLKIIIVPALDSGTSGCEETVDGCYIPKKAIVSIGGKVVFSNIDTVAHTFTADTTVKGTSGVFDSGLVIAGSSYEWTPTTEGEFPYHCIVHPWMEGTIFVRDEIQIPPTDTDGDGISDSSDSCMTEPETLNGYQDSDGCPDVVPPTDTDGDGISDSSDSCMTEPETLNGYQDSDGCPDVVPPTDTDGDGISDSIDQCPTQAETVNGFQDTDGCPDKIENDNNDLVLTYAAIGIGVAGAGTAIGIKLHGKGSGGKDAKSTESGKHDDDQDMSAHVEVRITGGIEE